MAAPGTSGAGVAPLQIVGLSATLPNVDVLSRWLKAELYVCNERPVPLSLCIASKGQVAHCDKPKEPALADAATASSVPAVRPRDPDGLTQLVYECVAPGQAVLIFCATKDWCEKAAAMLADEMPETPAEAEWRQLRDPQGAAASAQKTNPTNSAKAELDSKASRIEKMERRLKLLEELRLAPSGLCPVLAKTVPRGVAYHHAGLTLEERSMLEEAYRNGTISCLCATSTLAAGVNLPARRVIIRSMKVGSEALDATRFRQMAGRAGRVGLDCQGECVVVARSSRDAADAQILFTTELAPLKSSLTGQRLARAVLEVISLGLIKTVGELEGRFAHSLLRAQEEEDSSNALGQEAGLPTHLLEEISAALTYLEERRLVRVDAQTGSNGDAGSRTVSEAPQSPESASVCNQRPADAMLLATPLGDGVVHSALRPAEALSVFEDLQRSRKGICLDTDLHLIFLGTPASSTIEPNWARFLSAYEKLHQRDRAVATAVGVSHDFLIKQAMGDRGPLPTNISSASGGKAAAPDWRQERERITALHRRFWAALALRELAAETPAKRVAAMFSVPRGTLQALQSLAATYCGMVRQLCERIRWHEMAAMFDCIMPRLNFGASAEAMSLCKVPGVHPERARALLDAGFSSVEAVARAPLPSIEAVLRKLYQFESRCKDLDAAQRQEMVVRQTAARISRGAQERLGQELQSLEDEAEAEQWRVRRAAATAVNLQL
eukprot:TRINITY_DN31863_c0_g1_i1.p1 TRINITY_DN31863_c0_g1~~TRINITY_DN31863_c0_g1_i1.p1  ORF type:complete len:785 (-),score=184.21 TRINITY_DN31863_c0_g1_i1:371-2542(-)